MNTAKTNNMEQNRGIDKNQIAGILLIGAIMLGFGWWQTKNSPSIEPTTQDTEGVEQVIEEKLLRKSLVPDGIDSSELNSFVAEELTISNAKLSLTFSSDGAMLTSAALSGYHTYDDTTKTEALDFIQGK